jgi:RNA polymerase sigma-70 factor (ECF subfamily)
VVCLQKMSEPTDVSRLLERVGNGDQAAWDELLPRLYTTLHLIAHRLMNDQARGHTLQTTALVHEAFLKMAGGEQRWETRRHFERVAARAMRTVLVDHARARNAQKRGNGWDRVMLTDSVVEVTGPKLDVFGIDRSPVSLILAR